MSHKVYTTDSFVLGGVDVGEGHRYISLFTKDLGFLKAHARSVREERSKLRYSLQDFSYSHVSLVEGRDIWRITGAHEYHNLYYVFDTDPEKQKLFVRLFALLRRLLAGKEKNEYLFNILVEGFFFLKNTEHDKEILSAVECVLVLRVLHALGYIGNLKTFEELIESVHLSRELVETLTPVRAKAIAEINRALLASQL